jgi:hypothetical protein
MAVAYRSSNSQGFSGDPWSFTSPPSGTAENDILLAWLNLDASVVTVTGLPSGWTQIDTADAPDGDIRSYLFWKRAGASEAGPYSFDLSGAEQGIIAMAAYTGAVTTGDPQDVAGDVAGSATGTTHTSGTIVSVTNDCLICCFAGNDLSSSSTPQWSGWTNSAVERLDAESATFVDVGIADYTLATAGSTSFQVTAAVSDSAATGIVALKPAAGAAASDPTSWINERRTPRRRVLQRM